MTRRFEPNELCCVIWSVAKLGYTPAPDAWQQLLAAAARLAPKCSAQGLCNVVWAAATLKTTPQQQWMQVGPTPAQGKETRCGRCCVTAFVSLGPV